MAIKTPQDLIDYIMETPYNVNPNILKSALSDMEGGGSLEGDYNWDEAYELPLYQENNAFYLLKKDIDTIKNRLPHLIVVVNPDESRSKLIFINSLNDRNVFGYIFQNDIQLTMVKEDNQITMSNRIFTLSNDRYVSQDR